MEDTKEKLPNNDNEKEKKEQQKTQIKSTPNAANQAYAYTTFTSSLYDAF